jgi:hypothetical protein
MPGRAAGVGASHNLAAGVGVGSGFWAEHGSDHATQRPATTRPRRKLKTKGVMDVISSGCGMLLQKCVGGKAAATGEFSRRIAPY